MLLFRSLVVLSLLLALSQAFVVFNHNKKRHSFSARRHAANKPSSLPSPEESAKALTDFMAKSHEEKLKAMAGVEAKYQDRIQELEEKVKQLEARSPVQSPSSTNAYEMPATNKDLSVRVEQYRTFLSDYLVNAQKEKVQAVATAEAKLRSKYEVVIAELREQSKQQDDNLFAASPAPADAELSRKGTFQ